jgi:hypothetical protein
MREDWIELRRQLCQICAIFSFNLRGLRVLSLLHRLVHPNHISLNWCCANAIIQIVLKVECFGRKKLFHVLIESSRKTLKRIFLLFCLPLRLSLIQFVPTARRCSCRLQISRLLSNSTFINKKTLRKQTFENKKEIKAKIVSIRFPDIVECFPFFNLLFSCCASIRWRWGAAKCVAETIQFFHLSFKIHQLYYFFIEYAKRFIFLLFFSQLFSR